MAQTRPSIRTSRITAVFASSVAVFLAFAGSAFGAAITTPSGNQLPQGQTSNPATPYSASLSTDCGAIAGGWSFVGGLPAGLTGLTIGGSTGTTGAIGGQIDNTVKVQNFTVTIRFTPSVTGGGCTAGATTIQKAFTLPVLFKYTGSFGVQPTGVLGFNGTGQQVYVSSSQGNQVFQIASAATNPPSGTFTDFSSNFGTLNFPMGLAAIGAGATPTRLFATNFNSTTGTNAISRTNSAGLTTLTGCNHPAGVDANAAETAVFVACPSSGQIFQMNASGTVVGSALTLPGTSPAPAGVARIKAFKSGKGDTFDYVLVGDAQNDKLYLIEANGTSGPRVAVAPHNSGAGTISTITGATLNLPAGCVPANIASEANNTDATVVAYVACPGLGTIQPVTVAISGNTTLTLALGTQIAVGSRPFGVALNAAGTQLIVTDSGSDTARTMTVGQATGVVSGNQIVTNVGDAPSGIGLIEGTPAMAYIANEGSGGSVWVMDPPTKGNAAKKAKTSRKARKHRRVRKHRKHRRKAARSAQASNIALLRARAHSLPLTPPLD